MITLLPAASPLVWLFGTAAFAREPGAEDVGYRPSPATVAVAMEAPGPAPEALARELSSVEEEVTSLKERVFRSKATLELLKELVVDPAVSGSRLVLWHENDLGGAYQLVSAQYFIDGRSVYNRVDPTGGLDASRELLVAEQRLPPGSHTLQVNLVLRGEGYKLFSYLRDYQFTVSSSYAFDIEEGRASVLRVSAESRGGLRSFEERPTVRYDERTENYSEE
jgi:hypothetical protein